MSNLQLLESKNVRTHWDAELEKCFFSVMDVIEIFTDSPRPGKYWSALKTKLIDKEKKYLQNWDSKKYKL